MKTQAKNFFFSLAILALGLAYFPTLPIQGNNASNSINPSSSPQVKIIVTEKNSLLNNTKIEVKQAPLNLAGCSLVKGVDSSGLLQSQEPLNLQQPANCFSVSLPEAARFNLSVVELPQTQMQLLVEPLITARVKVVTLPVAKISGIHYRSAPSLPFNSETGMPLLVAAALFTIVGFSLRGFKFKKLLITQIKQSLSLDQLQMLRC